MLLLIYKAQKIIEMKQNSKEIIKSTSMEIADYKPFYKIENVDRNDILKIKISFTGNKNIPEFTNLEWSIVNHYLQKQF